MKMWLSDLKLTMEPAFQKYWCSETNAFFLLRTQTIWLDMKTNETDFLRVWTDCSSSKTHPTLPLVAMATEATFVSVFLFVPHV